MKAKDLKDIINQIPDEDNVIFTYSMFEFENASPAIVHGKDIFKYFKEEGIEPCNIPHGKKDWMIKFDN